MTEAAAYRGPDGLRTWTGETAHLAHLALDITAEDARETQPLVADDQVLVADARIDNRSALRRSLSDLLRSPDPTDADLVLAAYRRWGTDGPAHLLGDFAFAVWDNDAQRLFAARDPMGMRSLYYRAEERRLLVATEVKQILAVSDVPERLNEEMAVAYLAANFNDHEHTFYEGIRALPPAHVLVADEHGVRTDRYWDLDPDRRIRYDDRREYIEHFRELFKDAVRDRLRSTAPVGLLLSGGLDSGSVASTAGWLHENGASGLAPLRTYSWAFEQFPECDERYISDHIVEHYDFPATAIDAEAPDLLSRDPYVGPDRDEPQVTGFHGLYEHASERARTDGVRRLLTGHRGDLVTGQGLFDFRGFLRRGQWRTLWTELQSYAENTGMSVSATAKKFLVDPIRSALWPKGTAEWLRTPLRRLYRSLNPAPPPTPPVPPWVRPEIAETVSLPDSLSAPPGVTDPVRRQRYEALVLPLHMRVARLMERIAARYGLSPADPWSDRRLVEFAFAVPPGMVCRRGQNKWIVRAAMHDIMPEAARSRAHQINPYPLHQHALKVDLRPLIERLLLDLPGNIVDTEKLEEYYQLFCTDQKEDHRFWHTLSFELWLKKHFS
jgi:asparagine synthase (glutamine-hydrolysing)